MKEGIKVIFFDLKDDTSLFHLSGEMDVGKTAPSFGRAGNSGSPLNDWS
jgi:hypothetical protein